MAVLRTLGIFLSISVFLNLFLLLAQGSVSRSDVLNELRSDCESRVGVDEAYAAGIAAILDRHMESSYPDSGGLPQQRVEYGSIDDFLARNPECCTFDSPFMGSGLREFWPSEMWQDEFRFFGLVSARFDAFREITPEGYAVQERYSEVAIDVCGRVIWYDIDSDSGF